MSMEFIFDEATLLTDEQWERIISWHRKRSGREVLPVLPPAEPGASAPSGEPPAPGQPAGAQPPVSGGKP